MGYPMDIDLFSILTALNINPSDRVSVLALRDWLQEHGGEGSPLLVPVVWVVEEAVEYEGSEVRGIYASRKVAVRAVDVMIGDGNLRHVYRKVGDNEEGAEWEAGTRSFLLHAYKVKTESE